MTIRQQYKLYTMLLNQMHKLMVECMDGLSDCKPEDYQD